MILSHLSRPRILQPMTGNRQFIAPRQPELPLENRK